MEYDYIKKDFLFGEMSFKNLKFLYEEIELNKGINAEDYVKRKFENFGFRVFKMSKESKIAERSHISYVLKKEFKQKGKPDFFCIGNDGFEFFIEVKTKNDGLKINQIKWILENPNCLVYVFYLNQIIKEN